MMHFLRYSYAVQNNILTSNKLNTRLWPFGFGIGQMGHYLIDTVGNFIPDQWRQCST